MTKTPRRSVKAPGGGAAVCARPRATNGQFAKMEAGTASPTAPPPNPDAGEPPSGPALARRRPVAAGASKARTKRASTPAQLVTRVTRAIERELEEIEGIVGGAQSEADKRARTLASLARTLAEVTRLRSAANDERQALRKEASADDDNDALPRDLDDFRRTLERRLAQLVDAGAIGADRADEPG